MKRPATLALRCWSVSLRLGSELIPRATHSLPPSGADPCADVERLLKAGASPNIVDADGTPALMAATLFGGADLVKLLLDRGADPNRTGSGGHHRVDVGGSQPGESAATRRGTVRM